MAENHGEFLRRFTPVQPHLFAYIRAAGFGWNEAEDLLQEAAVALWESYGAYDPERPFLAWGIGVTRRVILSSRRAGSARPLVVDTEVCVKIANHLAESLELDRQRFDREREYLSECLEAMPAKWRDLIDMRYRQGLPLKQIAFRVGRSYAATNMWLSRVRGKLLDCMASHSEAR